MLDHVAAERGEKEVDNFVERMIANNPKNGQDKANEEAEKLRKAALARLASYREENRQAWIIHLRKTARAHLAVARSARARTRRLEQGES